MTNQITSLSHPCINGNRHRPAALIALLILTLSALFGFAPPALSASKIKVVVNDQPITSYDIARRAAFLKLRRTGGNRSQKATEELIDEAVQMQAAKRVNISVPEKEIDAAYARFAKSNRMPVKALTQILTRSGVTVSGFKSFIRAQMTWQRLLSAKSRAESRQSSSPDIFAKIRARGGDKPSTTEYTLQQVIFVVPKAKRRTLMAKRRRQATAFRHRFESCDKTRGFAKGLIDVTVRSLGRVMEPQLPPDWKKHVIATPQGKTTKVRDTHRGVEFLAVCRSQTVSDDRVAQLTFQQEQLKKGVSDTDKKYLKQLRKRATIVRR